MEFTDKAVQNRYDDLNAKAMELADALEDVEKEIQDIEDEEEQA